MSALPQVCPELESLLQDYLPHEQARAPFVTLTYAASLDSRISARRGSQTVISHVETKTMTHYLRSKHDAILVGVGTAEADDPGLNCRYKSGHCLRPVIIDPHFRWSVSNESRLITNARSKAGLAPWVVVAQDAVVSTPTSQAKQRLIEQAGGRLIELEADRAAKFDWSKVFERLAHEKCRSVMVEGGGSVLNDLLSSRGLVDSVIVTMGPVYLGKHGVEVSPSHGVRLEKVRWWRGVQDVVLAAKVSVSEL